MHTDRDLLLRYLRDGSQDAFAEIVRRHVNLVYGAAFRQLRGNASLAEDVTQAVFTALAAKAATLAPLTSLSSWLYTTTRYTVSHTVRRERRRQNRETQAYAMNEPTPTSPVSPEIPAELIGTALEALDNEEREAVLLRFVEGQAFGAVGLALGLSEDAARMRTSRALEKVRAFFARKGITSTTAAVAAALASEGMAAPAGFAGGVSTTALAAKAAGGGLFASFSAAKLVAAGALVAAAAALALRPAPPAAAPIPAGPEALSRHLAVLHSKKAVSATGLEQPRAHAAGPAASAEGAETDGSAGERAAARKHADENAEQAALFEKLAQLKPALLSGAPVTGTFVITKNGTVTDVPVSFVLGRGVPVDLGDSGTFLMTASLTPEGFIQYAFKGGAGASGVVSVENPDRLASSGKGALPAIINTPWSDFTVSTKAGAFAYMPDQAEPP